MISLPLNVADARKTIVFPSATTTAYAYANGYVVADTLQKGFGYWLSALGAELHEIEVPYDQAIDPAAVDAAREGWKRFRSGGHEVSYWQQDEQGRWQNRAARA